MSHPIETSDSMNATQLPRPRIAWPTSENMDLNAHLPLSLKLFTAVTLVISIMLEAYFLLVVAPVAAQTEVTNHPCTLHDSHMRQNAKMLFLSCALVIIACVLGLIPRIRGHLLVAGRYGNGYFCFVHVAFYGPLLIFTLSVALFCLRLLQSPECVDRNPKLYSTMIYYITFSCHVNVAHMALAMWRKRVLEMAFERQSQRFLGVPPKMFDKFASYNYHEFMSGHLRETYYEECPICLGAWEPADVIKLTPCKHAFHDVCLSTWFRDHTTCAMCRCDITLINLEGEGLRSETSRGPSCPALSPQGQQEIAQAV